MKHGRFLLVAALLSAVAVAAPACSANSQDAVLPDNGIVEEEAAGKPSEDVTQPSDPPAEDPVPPVTEEPVKKRAEYIKITADSVNVRSGAGTNYSVLGSAEKGTMYALLGRSGSWYKTVYRNREAYISASYCTAAYLDASGNDKVEAVIDEGLKCLGVPYVYGATRYLDENGKRISGFTDTKFDCSSLMQYIFKLGANVNLKLTTRTQIYQGETVRDELRRGDLMFFTNESRKYNSGVERIGHVALYLGGNYILHTASDYAKIEQISNTRWGYYIQSQRLL